MLEKYPKDVKLAFFHFPLKNHKLARPAAAASLAAEKQGRFWEFQEKLFQNFNALSEEKIAAIAGELELDLKKFDKDRKSKEAADHITRDLQQGQLAGVRGTPTIFINGKLLSNRSIAGFSQVIDRELKKK